MLKLVNISYLNVVLSCLWWICILAVAGLQLLLSLTAAVAGLVVFCDVFVALDCMSGSGGVFYVWFWFWCIACLVLVVLDELDGLRLY